MTDYRNIWSSRSSFDVVPRLWNEECDNNSNALRRHSYSNSQDTFDSKFTMNLINDYFTKDPHNRIKVTINLLNQRFFNEEKYLSDNYQLPKFPIETSLRNYQLVLVGFKAGRIDVFYLPSDNNLLSNLKVGDLVIVEADRGKDLGKIFKMNISIDEARLMKLLQFQEQQSALLESDFNDDELSMKNLSESRNSPNASPPPTLHLPKPILSLAQSNDILQVLNKNQDEEKACRLCLAKIANATGLPNSSSPNSSPTAGVSNSNINTDLLQMKLIDAEYQFDRKKLIFYYSTSKRIDFRDLVRELFRIYKTRIWMCAVTGLPYVPKSNQNTSPILDLSNSNSTGNMVNAAASGIVGADIGNYSSPAYTSMQSYNNPVSEQVPNYINNDSFQTPRRFLFGDYNRSNPIPPPQQIQQQHQQYQPIVPPPTRLFHVQPNYSVQNDLSNSNPKSYNPNQSMLNSQQQFFENFNHILSSSNNLAGNNRRQSFHNYNTVSYPINDNNANGGDDMDSQGNSRQFSSESFVLKSLVDSINH